jgi:pyrroline-5-carboxylate reductase
MQKAETLKLKPITLLLVGCGKMGGALLSRWAETHPAGVNHIAIVEPSERKSSSADVRFFTSLEKIPAEFKPNVVVFALKPQMLDETLPVYAKRFGAFPLYLSIAAGKSLAFFARHLGHETMVVRAMPNTPALIGEGITALSANEQTSPAQKKVAEALMTSAGKTVWLEETLMDAATAISGSGPAYVFLFMEALQQAAVQCGLPETLATELVRQTVKGGALLAQDEAFETLRKNVTSPNGTTEAAIKILQNGGFEKLLQDAVMAAMKRAKELS